MPANATLDGASLTRATDTALRYLRNNLRTAPNGSGAGWYHYLDDPRPGVTASAVGLFVFALAGQRYERADDVVEFLLNEQVTSSDDGDGGWPVRTSEGVPVIEATAWVVRALRLSGSPAAAVGRAVDRGTRWIVRNQNDDHGWGSYRGLPSRVFLTALTTLALQECGGHEDVLGNARRWLLDAGSTDQPAWGALPGSPPTLLHTSFALLALAGSDLVGAPRVREISEWLIARLEPGVHAEEETQVEDYDVPLPGDRDRQFQNTLSHFAGPVAVCALLRAGANPLDARLFATVDKIVAAQRPTGVWPLPRSPTRPSIWAVWPFVAALTESTTRLLPTRTSRVHLISPGCAVVQTESSRRDLTRGALAQIVRNALFDWIRRRKIAILLYTIALVIAGTAAALLISGRIGLIETMITLIIPVLLLVFQLGWDRRRGSGP